MILQGLIYRTAIRIKDVGERLHSAGIQRIGLAIKGVAVK